MTNCKNYKLAEPTDSCICGHMLKSHKSTTRWNNKKKTMDCRIKCRFCKCNELLETCDNIS